MRHARFYVCIAIFMLMLPGILPAAEPPSREGSLRSELSRAKTRSRKARLWAELAALYRSRGDDERALEAVEQGLELNPARKERYALLMLEGDIAFAKGQFAPAIDCYQNAVAASPRSDGAHLRLAAVYEQSELYELSRQEYLVVLSRNRKSFDANFGLASLYFRQGMTTRALEYYRHALVIRSNAEVYRRISSCAENTGDITLAVAMLRQALSASGTYEDYINLGRLYEEQKKSRDAEESFSQAIKLDPDKIEGYLHLSLLYIVNDELTPAEKLLQIAQEKAPKEGLIHFFLAQIYYRRKDVARAKEEIRQARQLARSDILARYSAKFEEFLSR